MSGPASRPFDVGHRGAASTTTPHRTSALAQDGLGMSLILEVVMPRWYECANEASFKSTAEGHVFQAPSPWMFARPSYYLVNGTQKAQLLACLGRWRLLLLIVTAIEVSLTLAITLPMIM